MADLLARLAEDGLLNEDAASLLDGGAEDGGVERRNVVLVGVTGDGKSSTGNTLCGAEAFCVQGGFKSVTQECAHADFLRAGTFWRVIDTIGLHDTDLGQKEVLDRFSKFADKVPDGIDAFVFIVRWGRFKPEHDAALTSFITNCGDSVLQHTLLCFTHCRDSPGDLQQALMSDAPASLRTWLPRIHGGAIGIENLPPGAADFAEAGREARESVSSALERLLSRNGGMRYTNEALAEARLRMAAVEEAEKAAFANAVADWRKGSGPVTIEREDGVVTRPAGSYGEASGSAGAES